jgi:cell division protein ZapA
MANNKVDIPVVINGKVYTLSGYEGEDYLQNVATYINSKISECKASDQYRRMNTEYQGVLLALNIADDYFKAKSRADSMVSEDTNKEQQLYDLRHEVIEAQIKQESAVRMIEEYKEQINALQRKIIQLEAEKGNKGNS